MTWQYGHRQRIKVRNVLAAQAVRVAPSDAIIISDRHGSGIALPLCGVLFVPPSHSSPNNCDLAVTASPSEIKDCHSTLPSGNAMGCIIMHPGKAMAANRSPPAHNFVFGPARLKSKILASYND
jgi:hypothetical protein